MAASAAIASSSPGLCPNYAVICSFLERYGALLDLPELTFPQLERYLQDTSSVPKLLADLHVKLLRKIGKSVSADRWEKHLVKICQEVNAAWAWELEQKGYKELPVEGKTAILKHLCECQFDENIKFKTAVNDEDPDKMRLQPIGRDKDGQMYWFQLDQDDNVRVYVEEQDDLDGSSWKCIVRTRNDLAEVVALLKTQIDPALLKRDEELKNKTDQEDKEKGDIKKEDASDEDGKDTDKTVCSEKHEETQKDELKSEVSEEKSSLNGIVEGKPQAELEAENVVTKAESIKEEPMELASVKPNPTEPIPLCETSSAPTKEEAKKKSSEEIHHSMKNEHQAKIPLKKRGMKFSEDFDKNGTIAAQNPAITNLKEARVAESAFEPPPKIPRVNDQVNGEIPPSSEKEQTSKSRENVVPAAGEDGSRVKTSETCSTETLKEAKSQQSNAKRLDDEQELKNGVEKSSSHEKLEHRITESGSSGKTDSDRLDLNQGAKSKEADSESTSTKMSNGNKSESSASKEEPESTKTDAETSVDSKASVSVIKTSITDKSEETKSLKEVVAKDDQSESPKPEEQRDKTRKESLSKAGKKEAENPDRVTKVSCEDHTMRDVTPANDSTSRPTVEPTLGEDNLTKPQEGHKTDTNVDERKTPDIVCEGKNKPPSPVEKTCKETEEKSQELKKEEEKKSDSKEPRADGVKDTEKLPNDKEKEDSSSEGVSKSKKETKKSQKQKQTSVDEDGSELQKSSKEPEVESSKTEKQTSEGFASDEQSKNKSKEVENGGEAPATEDACQRSKRPAHRRRAELQREERHGGDSESDTNTRMCLRRSPRISKPTQKAVEIQDKKTEKPPTASPPQKDEEEEEENEEETQLKAVQKKPKEKRVNQESHPKVKGRKRRRTRWSNTRARRKKKNSDDESENSDEESSEEEESEEEEDDSDEDYKVERNRKRRNRNRERRSSDSSTSSSDDLPPNDDPCKHCGLPNHPELILLCDSCDNGYHTACLRPPLMIIPDGEWFCPPCQHKQLCDKLEEQLQNLDAALKKKERAERRKERLIYVGISLENIIEPSVEVEEEKPDIIIKEKKEAKRSKSWGRRSTRAKKTISYRFDEFDEAIEEAIEEDIKEAEGGGAGRGKDMANITGHRGKDISTILQAEEGKENGRPPRPNASQRKKKRRRLNDLDSDSTVDDEESEEEFCLSESSEEEFVASDNDSEPETDQDSKDSEFGSNRSGRHHSSSRSRRPQKRRQSSRKRRRPKWFSDDEEETDDEVEEDEIVTEGSSDFSDSDLDMSRRRSRRSHKKEVNYCETSESEGSQAETNRAKMKPRRRRDSSDSDASFSKDSEEDLRGKREKRRADSSEEDFRQRRRRLALKRRRASEDDDSDDSSDESSEEDRPVRKRVNRIDSDDDDDEQDEEKPKKLVEEDSKGTNQWDSGTAELQSTNGQNAAKSHEGFANRPAPAAPGLVSHLEPPKSIGSTPAAATAPNGLVGQEIAAQDDEEDDLLGVTDLVDYVCNNEQL
ncbi:remodeling and spacing factor 1 [Nothobranchius furzeri]|uniref:Remodeling and spacing factor 1 n=2 Tax=Nothobranchius TaxID=28779 RepID=A0A1A7Z7X0_NOTFU|nr:remodeling and spacing factor 1-like [Nothobranchius furzeri]